MKRIWLMLIAVAFFVAAPVVAQEAGSAGEGGAAEESAPGLPGDNEGDDAVQDTEVVGADEGEGAEPAEDAAGLPGDNEGDDAVQDAEVVGQDEGEEGADAAVAGGGAAGDQPWTFTAFDENGDGFLSEAEFRGGFFEFISDEPARISQDRYEGAIDTFTLGGVPDFETADANGDGFLDEETEFSSAFAPDLFQSWDANSDSQLSAHEYVSGMMATFDADANGTFDQQEFQANAQWFETGFRVAGGGGAEGGFDESFFLGESAGSSFESSPADDAGMDDATEEVDEAAAGDAGDDATEEAEDAAADEASDDNAADDEMNDPAEDAGDDANQQ
ncbi:MAG TPA: hypothetical protein VF168_14960 [Trueperaceae bacterium]